MTLALLALALLVSTGLGNMGSGSGSKSIWICPFWGVKISIFMLTLKISVFWMVICTLENLHFYVNYCYLMLSKLSSCVNEIFKCDSSEGSLFQTKPNETGRVWNTLWCRHASNQVCLKSYSLKVLTTIITASQILNPHYRFRSCLMSKIHQQLSSTVNRSSTVQFNGYSTQYHSWNSLNYYSIQQSKIIQLFTGWWYSYPEKSWSEYDK